MLVPAILALVKLVLHLATSGGYGIFRDELYYLACADHLAWGYVDQPPLSIAILAATRAVAGDSLLALRVMPALAGALTVLVAGVTARELGGGRFAQALAGLAVIAAPLYLALDHYFSMNAFDVLAWSLATLLLVRILKGEQRWWWILGVVLGLGLLNKVSVFWLIGGLGVGLLLSSHRRLLLTRGPWLALGLAAVIFVPHVIWQVRHGWPTLEFVRNATATKMAPVTVPGFLREQFLAMNPLNAPIWLAGLGLAFSRAGARWRPVAIAFLAVTALLAASGTARVSYLAPAYVGLFALGGVAIESLLRTPLLRAVAPVPLVASALLLAPLALPVLPIETYRRYAARLGVEPGTEEKVAVGPLPQFFADMFGWEPLAQAVAGVYRTLTPDERQRGAIFANNYGEAGAIDFFGRRLGLPGAISGHNNYWLWGPGSRPADPTIVIGGNPDGHRKAFDRVEAAAVVPCRYCMPYERDLVLYVCRGLRRPLGEIWPRTRHYQ